MKGLLISLAAVLAAGTASVQAGPVKVEAPEPYSYEDDSVIQLKVKGKYGRYLTFRGRAPVYYSATAPSCRSPKNSTRVYCSPGSPAGYVSYTWRYQLDCQDRTFNRDSDSYDWMHVDNDPVAEAVANKYCPTINSLYKDEKGYIVNRFNVNYGSQSLTKKQDFSPFQENAALNDSDMNVPRFDSGEASKGYDAYKKGNYKKSIRYYTKAIKKDPRLFNAYIARAASYEALGETQRKCDDYISAKSIDNKRTEKYIRSKDSIWISTAIDCHEFYREKAISEGKAEKYLSSLVFVNKAIKFIPDDESLYLARGMSKDKTGDYEGAKSDYLKVIQMEPNGDFATGAYWGMCYLEGKDNNFKAALSYCNKGIKLEPNNLGLYGERAYVKYLMGNYKSALKDANKVISKEPDNGNILHTIGLAKYKLGNVKEGCLALRKSASLDVKESKDYLSSEKGSWCK